MNEPVCPICKQTDSLDWVGSILQRGTMHTNGFNVMYIPTDGIAPGISMSTSMTDFTAQFVAPRKFGVPTAKSILLSLLLWAILLTVVVTEVWFHPTSAVAWVMSAYLSLLVSLPLTIVATIISESIRYGISRARRMFWQFAHKKLWYSLYCSRDNIIFSNVYAAPPQEYIDYLFNRMNRAKHAVGYN